MHYKRNREVEEQERRLHAQEVEEAEEKVRIRTAMDTLMCEERTALLISLEKQEEEARRATAEAESRAAAIAEEQAFREAELKLAAQKRRESADSVFYEEIQAYKKREKEQLARDAAERLAEEMQEEQRRLEHLHHAHHAEALAAEARQQRVCMEERAV